MAGMEGHYFVDTLTRLFHETDFVGYELNGKIWTEERKQPWETIIQKHVRGEVRVGAYPFVSDEHVAWMCIDLDTKEPDAARRIVSGLEAAGISRDWIYAERSKSKGWHFWVWFQKPQKASAVRKAVLPHLPQDVKFDFFPRQDKKKRAGNFVFIPCFGGEINLLNVRTKERTLEIDYAEVDFPDVRVNNVVDPPPAEPIELEGVPPCVRLALSGVEQGMRNEAGFLIASYFRDRGDLINLLREWNTHNRPPLPDSEVERLASNDYSEYPRVPCNHVESVGLCPEPCDMRRKVARRLEIEEKYGVRSFSKKAETYLRRSLYEFPWKSSRLTFLTCGLPRQDITVVGGLPSHGKTTFALDHAIFWAERGRRVMFASLEMAAEQLMAKLLAHYSSIPYNKLVTQGAAMDLSEIWNTVYQKLDARLVIIDDTYEISKIAEAAIAWEADILIVDWIQLLDRTSQNPVYEIGDRMKELKSLAKIQNIPILVMAQSTRDFARTDRPPTNADLADSSMIEKLACTVVFLEDPSPGAGSRTVNLHCTKARYGALGLVKMIFDPDKMSYFAFPEDAWDEAKPQEPPPRDVGSAVLDNLAKQREAYEREIYARKKSGSGNQS